MDQVKIGKFIKEKRKELNMTQNELAEKLNVTDRSISKWENGICMPDFGIVFELCKVLNITINDLFSGEVVDMKNNEKRLEENLLEMVKLKQAKDKQLLNLEIFIGVLAVIILLFCIIVASLINMKDVYRIILITFGFVVFLVSMFFALRIEQTAGYYECRKCNHKYVPKYFSVFSAMHVNRTRYMKCPKCNKYSWNKKVIND